MGNGDGNTAPPVKSFPPPIAMKAPPRPSPPQILSLVTAGAAATAGFLGCCEVAGVLALLSLIFGFWDFFQYRDLHRHRPHRYDSGGAAETGTAVSASSAGTPGRDPDYQP
ncbi:MAG TPA: hypothetical protein VLV54_04125 [Thermoanaerobaculia bacterium]|nr:hypothetical protein [Thermoanaerobaculia bacterium]